MAWRGSISRSLLAAGRSSPPRRPSIPSRLFPPFPSIPRRRLSSAPSRYFLTPGTFISADPFRSLNLCPRRSLGELGCVQLLLPLREVAISPCLTSHLSASVRACCELSQDSKAMRTFYP
ncbi:hypothetical protein C4D60_Mb07t20760 [Musa balbisiana]|uniref:Uncharacterized protein n=1 Tax=Musa balbisiana TaxID=52838 RepID=A0A4V6T4F3_MUSBA|nr:hypothetical protein C4D60_Mb07t20760 [Musa balbisiana]